MSNNFLYVLHFTSDKAGINSLATPCLLKIVGSDEKKFGNAYGILNLCLGIGSWVGPYIAGFISDKSNMFITFCVTSTFLAIAGIVSSTSFIFLRRKHQKN
jgi:hypothetical protein